MAKKHLRYTAEKGESPSPFQLSFNIHRFTSPYFPSIAPLTGRRELRSEGVD